MRKKSQKWLKVRTLLSMRDSLIILTSIKLDRPLTPVLDTLGIAKRVEIADQSISTAKATTALIMAIQAIQLIPTKTVHILKIKPDSNNKIINPQLIIWLRKIILSNSDLKINNFKTMMMKILNVLIHCLHKPNK